MTTQSQPNVASNSDAFSIERSFEELFGLFPKLFWTAFNAIFRPTRISCLESEISAAKCASNAPVAPLTFLAVSGFLAATAFFSIAEMVFARVSLGDAAILAFHQANRLDLTSLSRTTIPLVCATWMLSKLAGYSCAVFINVDRRIAARIGQYAAGAVFTLMAVHAALSAFVLANKSDRDYSFSGSLGMSLLFSAIGAVPLAVHYSCQNQHRTFRYKVVSGIAGLIFGISIVFAGSIATTLPFMLDGGNQLSPFYSPVKAFYVSSHAGSERHETVLELALRNDSDRSIALLKDYFELEVETEISRHPIKAHIVSVDPVPGAAIKIAPGGIEFVSMRISAGDQYSSETRPVLASVWRIRLTGGEVSEVIVSATSGPRAHEAAREAFQESGPNSQLTTKRWTPIPLFEGVVPIELAH